MSQDSLLFLSQEDKKLPTFLRKMGYHLIENDNSAPLPELIARQVVDLVILDSRIEQSCLDICQYLRQEVSLKKVPLVVLSKSKDEAYEIKKLGFERVELIDIPYSVGSVATKIATLLRLRKMAGGTDSGANVSEMNAALRDLNARFKQERDEARAIQQSLLPANLPSDSRYDLAVAYEPLDEVGGDWYYVQRNQSGRISVQISDVTGHGLAAAFIGSMTKLAMSAANKERPHELLTEMNRLMTPQLPEGRFVTMAGYLYEPDTGKIEFARAGHPPALVLNRKQNQVAEVKADGFAIGFFEEGAYTNVQTTLEQNDMVLMLTDGISEAQNRDFAMYGSDRINKLLLKSDPKHSAAQVLDIILKDFRQFIDGRKLKDDVTLIILKRL